MPAKCSLLQTSAGTLVEAHNTGRQASAIAAGGVLFDDSAINPLGRVFAGANPSGLTGDADFDNILNTASWRFGAGTLTLRGLSVGEHYRLQLFVADDRNAVTRARTVTLDDLMGNTHTSGPIGNGYAFTGLFTASEATKSIRLTGSSVAYINA